MPERDRPAIGERLKRLSEDRRARHAYGDILVDVWQAASSAWERRGRKVVADDGLAEADQTCAG